MMSVVAAVVAVSVVSVVTAAAAAAVVVLGVGVLDGVVLAGGDEADCGNDDNDDSVTVVGGWSCTRIIRSG